MSVSPVAYRYANSLMQLAREQGAVEQVREDMRLAAETCAASNELRVLLKSPVIKADKKQRVLGRVFGGRIGPITGRFVDILVRKGREVLLPEIAEAFANVYNQAHGILVAEVRSAVPLSPGAMQRVQQLVAGRYPGKNITLNTTVEPALIGGVVVRVGDEQVDASVSRRLGDLRRKFSENPYIPEI